MTGEYSMGSREEFEQLCQNTNTEAYSFGALISGLPPSECATAHPNNFNIGEAIPDQENSLIISSNTGIYSVGMISRQGELDFARYNPDAQLSFGPDIPSIEQDPLRYQFGIASLATAPPEAAPEQPATEEPKIAVLDPITPGGR